MTIPASGPVTFTDIQTEFGGTNPIALNEYYAGGGLVPAATSGTYGPVPSSGALTVQNFYGTSALIPVYPQNVFAVTAYTGVTGSNVTINNGINLSGNGGLIWSKGRNQANPNALTDTVRGVSFQSSSNATSEQTGSGISSFTSTGYVTNQQGQTNGGSSETYVSWTFQEQPKFFDVVTATAVGSTVTFAHNLGSSPGFVAIKKTSASEAWYCYHTSLGVNTYLSLNTNGGADTLSGSWTVSSSSVAFNYASAGNYVAYIYASNAGGFGPTGTDNAISCGSFVSNIAGGSVNLGYQPQFLISKITAAVGLGWYIMDSQRGFTLASPSSQALQANTAGVEGALGWFTPTATGFDLNAGQLSSGYTYVYIAIRKPM